MIGTVGLVLAAGALSLAELATESAGEGAATSVEERAVAEPEEIVEPSVSVAPPDGPAKVTEKPRASAGSPRPGGEATGKGNGAPGGESSKQAGEPGDGDGSEPSASEPPDGDGPSPSASQDPPEGGESPESPGEPGGPGEGDDPPPPPQAPPSQQPAPTPTPTCDRFLWWCL
ncbi:hypothetical protein [Streptomyces sp. NPDC005805]|uniref:hypothetical protein n=1 Tax=Streptomyces sp. NPDC005805 TaxID=3157068 RepID=UPI0033EB7893